MTDTRALQGLNCPRCGGTLSIPEGQAIVQCPYCDLRALVRGDRGVRHYQVPNRIDRQAAAAKLNQFLSSSWSIGFTVRSQARLSEVFLAHVPFWTSWARVLSWVFGERREGSGKNEHWVPREVKITEDMTWTGAACDVSEFGVHQVPLTNQALEPYNADALHASGLVFEPVSSMSEAQTAARQNFEARVRGNSRLGRVAQATTRYLNERFAALYYPLWILRYLYRGRAFQVVVDGYSGEVLYGKAPGNTYYRAAMLIGGMALGALVAVDGFGLLAYGGLKDSGNDSLNLLGGAFIVGAIGLGMMYSAYRAFRYGEVYEYHRYPPAEAGDNAKEGIAGWLNLLR